MKYSTFASALALAATAIASPTGCITTKEANHLVQRFIGIQNHQGSDLGDMTATAEAILVKNYEEISDSILSLEQLSLGGVTFQGRSEYIASLSQAPAPNSIETLGIYVAGCSKVLWQWQYNVGTGVNNVKGFNLFTTNRKNQIVKTELEFNSVAWGQDTFQLPCGSSSSSSSSSSESDSTASAAASTPTAT